LLRAKETEISTALHGSENHATLLPLRFGVSAMSSTHLYP